MKVLVTGGAGFIGSHIAQRLQERGDAVVVADDLSSGKTANIPEGVPLVQGDLSRADVAREAVDGCDAVVHCAARPSVAGSIDDPVGSNEANLQASSRLLVACRDAGVKRLVYSSSSAVYGGTDAGSVDESRRERPMSPYGMNKLAAEHLFRMAPDLFDVDTVCLRYFNVYGPRQDASSPYSGVISLFVTLALQGRAPTIHGDGLQSRDFTYVDDVVAANLAALDVGHGGGRVMNVGRGLSTTVNELWEAILLACGAGDLQAQHVEPRAGDIRHSLADVRAAREHLGFEAATPLETGIAATVAWYRAALSHAR